MKVKNEKRTLWKEILLASIFFRTSVLTDALFLSYNLKTEKRKFSSFPSMKAPDFDIKISTSARLRLPFNVFVSSTFVR